jgi:Secretion system C-terminal sorting domain
MKKVISALCFLLVFSFTRAGYVFIPMDAAQANHLKAYGIAFKALKAESTVQWLLNYRGGSFVMPETDANVALLKGSGVSYELLTEHATEEMINTVLSGANNMNLVTMNRVPRIALYASPVRAYDDAVALVLTYAGIDFTTIYDKEMLTQDLSQYDWIHLDHEDFTGQYNKWYAMYNNTAWYKADVAQNEALAKELGYAKVSQMKLAVAKKLRSFVENGGQLFAMCAGTEKLDIALAAEGVDIVSVSDGDAADPLANTKLNYSNTFAFQGFTVNTNGYVQEHSNIDAGTSAKKQSDQFTLTVIDAKKDLTGAMLTQNHKTLISEFLGNTTAFKKEFIKPEVSILGGSAADTKYLHGQRGKGYFTFYAGHDPECFTHRVGDKATVVDNFKQSPGYRLILNNALSPSVSYQTLGVSNAAEVGVKTFPNPFVNYFTVEMSSDLAKDAKLLVYNLGGQVVITDDIRSDSGVFSKQYNTENLAGGLYIVEIRNAKGTISKSLIARLDL